MFPPAPVRSRAISLSLSRPDFEGTALRPDLTGRHATVGGSTTQSPPSSLLSRQKIGDRWTGRRHQSSQGAESSVRPSLLLPPAPDAPAARGVAVPPVSHYDTAGSVDPHGSFKSICFERSSCGCCREFLLLT